MHLNLKDKKVLSEKVSKKYQNILHLQSLLHNLRKDHDDSYGFHNCCEYKATSKRSLINIKGLKEICQKNIGKIVIGNLNINSIRHKLDSLIEITTGNIDILMILETKLDESFLKDQFLIKGFSEPYRLDRNSKGGGIILFIREDIRSKLSIGKNSIKTFYEEVNLQKV